VQGQGIKMGSASYINDKYEETAQQGSQVFISINGEVRGNFVVKSPYRAGLDHLADQLEGRYTLALLSGDNNAEERKLRNLLGKHAALLFGQRPQDKLEFIKYLQRKGSKVIMLGDGLNDAGALKQSDAGIVISDNINNFSPSCDAILEGKSFPLLKQLLDYCRREKFIIGGSFIISIVYNVAGLYYAVQGTLQPVIAAILMPLSSASIMLFTTSFSSIFAIGMKKK